MNSDKIINNYKQNKIIVFYNELMCPHSLGETTETPSPLKPKLLMDFLHKVGLDSHFLIDNNFTPFENKEFYLAHTREYVDGFFNGVPPYSTGNGLLGVEWDESFANSVRYTNSSLYNAISGSINNPAQIYLSPTSGFHHAVPEQGALFCAFSGQVISAIKIYQDYKMSGAFIDLDGHFGNSIEDSRSFVKNLDLAIPKGCNINIKTKHSEYLEDLKIRFLILQELILENKVHYVVFCHGADSHEEDDIGSQLNTAEWVECAEMFCKWVLKIENIIGRSLPVSLSLFGGYRIDDFESVLSLHTASLIKVLSMLSNIKIEYIPRVSFNKRKQGLRGNISS